MCLVQPPTDEPRSLPKSLHPKTDNQTAMDPPQDAQPDKPALTTHIKQEPKPDTNHALGRKDFTLTPKAEDNDSPVATDSTAMLEAPAPSHSTTLHPSHGTYHFQPPGGQNAGYSGHYASNSRTSRAVNRWYTSYGFDPRATKVDKNGSPTVPEGEGQSKGARKRRRKRERKMKAEAADQDPSVKEERGVEQWPMKIKGWEGSMGLAGQEGENEKSIADRHDARIKTEGAKD